MARAYEGHGIRVTAWPGFLARETRGAAKRRRRQLGETTMSFKSLALGAVAAGALLAGSMVGEAKADALSWGAYEITNATLNWHSGTLAGNQVSANDFTIFGPQDSVNANVELNAVTDSTGSSGAPAASRNIDPAQLGNGTPYPDNNFTNPLGGSPSYVYADGQLIGATVTDIPGVQSNVEARVFGESHMTNSDSGSAGADTKNLTSFQFQTNIDGQFRFDLDAALSLLATTDATGLAAGVNSTFQITISQVGVGTIFEWVPDGNGLLAVNGGDGTGSVVSDDFSLNQQVQAFTGGDTQSFSDSGFFSAITPTLFAANQYTLQITQQILTSATNLAVVPEPGSLALLGAGLALVGGLGFRGRRKMPAA